ncbi:hypothetical protein CHS0354_037014 [Potamilus streckersoni]|uniref:chitin synthase n=1 Tax=Potamilus streckersoni TaxID=2493646 RepID=A0AAE0VY43_9BIVA|nr:hypothetical protein CHS0354_037014 [Potamilus streckersoni]
MEDIETDGRDTRVKEVYGPTQPLSELPQSVRFPGRTAHVSLKHLSFNMQDRGHTNPAYDPDGDSGSEDNLSRNNIENNSDDDDEEDDISTSGFQENEDDQSDINSDDIPAGLDAKELNDALQEGKGPPPEEKKAKKEKSWDVFREVPSESVSGDNLEFWRKAFVITKIIVCIVLFLTIIVTTVISKMCFILVVSNIFPNNNTALRSARNTLIYKDDKTNVLWIWAMIMIIGAPYFFTICRCLWRLIFMITKRKSFDWVTLFSVLLMETLHSIGLNVLIYYILPNLDPVSGTLFCVSVATFPGILKVLYPRQQQENVSKMWNIVTGFVNFISVLVHLGSIGLWCYFIVFRQKEWNYTLLVCVIFAPLLISLLWWENYTNVEKGDREDYGKRLGLVWLAKRAKRQRTKLCLIVNIWKLILAILLPIAIFGPGCGINCIRTLFLLESKATLDGFFGSTHLTSVKHFGSCSHYLPLVVAAISIFCSGVCYKAVKTACKITAQVFCVSLPLALTTPVSIAILFGIYAEIVTTSKTGCNLPFPAWDKKEGSPKLYLDNITKTDFWMTILAGLAGYLSFLMICNHIWAPEDERLQRTDKLFVLPLYEGVLLEQSIGLNRRRHQADAKEEEPPKRELPLPDLDLIESMDENLGIERSPWKMDTTPLIYLCATMWHENENEMVQLLKSIVRMDEDQCTRKNFQLLFGRRDPDYYEFEAHIFFDDAFDAHLENGTEYNVNKWVKQLVRTVDVAVCAHYGFDVKTQPPTKIPTPYGGQLVWKLPGGNKIIAHLKDKQKIRHRKRWSQVMYMYYFLAYKLLNRGLKRRRLMKVASHTFLLALDGDVDFQPRAVLQLVDRMRKNYNVGAACGRIHPIGDGAMVWYQKFEYAISHWLQKAAEDKMGCVLCSPGCFSMFRGSALMDDNVMKRYTTTPTEARHYVQYDQGEDRWLCTLLLQQGHRVEYAAASDALTYAPEGFYEFFNQRRRWSPSTMANILDLLTDWKNVTTKNPDISIMYILYQGLLMISSILTPGTIFLLVLGAINMAYPEIQLWVSMFINITPVAVFVLLCFVAKGNIQLTYAAILSLIYSLVMMIVIVGLLRQAAQFGWCSVTTMFLLFVAGIFVLSAFLHPQEFFCLIHGFLYFLAIPSTSLLMILYSLANLHVVSWGTRETTTPVAPQPAAQTQNNGRGIVGSWLERIGIVQQSANENQSSDYQFSCGNLMRCVCCPQPVSQAEDMKLRAILDRLDDMESRLSQANTSGIYHSLASNHPQSPDTASVDTPLRFSAAGTTLEGGVIKNNPMYEEPEVKKRDDLKNPYWLDDGVFRRGDTEHLPEKEIEFWNELIEEYLHPLDEDKKQKDAIHKQLIQLRNKVCLFFILINALFVTIVFSLQQVTASTGSLSIKLPCANSNNPGQRIEPISMSFTLIFGILLFVQFVCMLMHRFATILHVCASTEIFRKKMERPIVHGDDVPEEVDVSKQISVEQGLALVKSMQMPKVDDDAVSIYSSDSSIGESEDLDFGTLRKKQMKERWRRLAKKRHAAKGNLNGNFVANMKRLNSIMIKEGSDNVSERPEDQKDKEAEEEDKVEEVQKTFKKFERKTLQTIVRMVQNQKLKDAIAEKTEKLTEIEKKRRTKKVQSKWQEVMRRKQLQDMNNPNKTDNVDGADRKKNAFAVLVQGALAQQRAKEDANTVSDNQTTQNGHNIYENVDTKTPEKKKTKFAIVAELAYVKQRESKEDVSESKDKAGTDKEASDPPTQKKESKADNADEDFLTRVRNLRPQTSDVQEDPVPKLETPKVLDDQWPSDEVEPEDVDILF